MIIDEVKAMIEGPKRAEYGPLLPSFRAIAALWSAVLGVQVSSAQVALCMILLKVYRESFKHSDDNLRDIMGYAHCLDQLLNEEDDERVALAELHSARMAELHSARMAEEVPS